MIYSISPSLGDADKEVKTNAHSFIKLFTLFRIKQHERCAYWKCSNCPITDQTL